METKLWDTAQIVVGSTQEAAESGVENFISNAGTYAVKIVGAIAAFFVMMIIAGILARLVKKAIVKHKDDQNAQKVGKLVRDIVYYIMIGFAVFVAFEMLGFDLGLLLWWVSFGIWLAFKEILWNMIAGIMILYTKQIKLWDVIEVQTDVGYFGRVEEITIRYTIIRTLDLRQVVIPNLKLISVPIKTFSSEQMVKLNTVVGIHYDSDLEKAVQVVVNAVNSMPFVLQKENTVVYVINFGESSIDLKCLFLFDPNSGLVGEFAVGLVNKAIWKAFVEHGITIPYPHRTLLFSTKEDQEKFTGKTDKPPVVVSPQSTPRPLQSNPNPAVRPNPIPQNQPVVSNMPQNNIWIPQVRPVQQVVNTTTTQSNSASPQPVAHQ